MKKLNMKKKWLSVISVLILFTSAIPGTVSAGSGSLSPEDSRLARSVTVDAAGNVAAVVYYNEKENILLEEDYSTDDPAYSFREYYTYDETGEYLQELRRVYYNDTAERFTYQYNEDQLQTGIYSWLPNGDLEWKEESVYDSRGNVIRTEYQHAEGQVYIKEIEYDDAGRETGCTESSTVNGETSVWKSVKSYSEIDDFSWSAATVVYDENDEIAVTYTERWVYDSSGNLLSSTEYKEGTLYQTVNTFDSNGLLIHSEIRAEEDLYGDAYTADFFYRPDQRLQKEVYGAGGYMYTTEYFYTLKPFSDVDDTAYFAVPVKWAVNNGITSGLTPAEFGPYESCTRAQAVTFLWRSAGQPEPDVSDNPFQDVHESDYYYKAVLWAVENGITKGISPELFGADLSCSRGQIVTFLHRFKGEPGLCGTVKFTDVHESDYYFGAVLWAVSNGITNGTSENTFSPEDACTRGQIVTFLYRAMN